MISAGAAKGLEHCWVALNGKSSDTAHEAVMSCPLALEI